MLVFPTDIEPISTTFPFTRMFVECQAFPRVVSVEDATAEDDGDSSSAAIVFLFWEFCVIDAVKRRRRPPHLERR